MLIPLIRGGIVIRLVTPWIVSSPEDSISLPFPVQLCCCHNAVWPTCNIK